MSITPAEHFNMHPSAWKENHVFARWLVNKVKPNVTVDLGVDWGHSTLCWASAKVGKVYGIDTWEPNSYSTVTTGNNYETFRENFKVFAEHGLNNIELIQSDHRVVEAKWDKKIDIIHFDILHDYLGVADEYKLWKKHVNVDGVYVFHDTKSSPDGVGRFFKQLPGPKAWFDNQFGLGVMSNRAGLIDTIVDKFEAAKHI